MKKAEFPGRFLAISLLACCAAKYLLLPVYPYKFLVTLHGSSGHKLVSG